MNERTPVPSRRARLLVVVAVATFGALLLTPGSALAENTVASSTPSDGASVATSPAAIEITFTEPLGEVNTVAVQCDAKLYTVGPRKVSDDRLTLSADLVEALPKADCVASWGVSGADGTPNGAGNISFRVQNDPAAVATTPATDVTATTVAGAAVTTAPATTATSDVAQLSSVDSGQGPLWLGRLVSDLGIAVLFGSLVLIAAAWPEGVEYLLAVRFVRATWVLAFAGTLLYVAAATAAVTGSGLGSGLNPTNWTDLFNAGLPGIAAVLRLVLVVACAWVAFRPDRVIDPVTQMAGLLIPAATVATIGLSRTDMDLAFIAVPLSVIHVLAMSIWIGGVVLLARVVLAGPGEEDLVHAVRGFGRLSTGAIVVTIATGITQMVLLDGGNLFGSPHGRVLLLKTVVVAFMIFIAMSARQYVNSKLPRTNEMTIATADRLRRAFGAEMAAGLLVLALSSWLVSLDPPNISTTQTANYVTDLRIDAPEADLDVTVKFTNDVVGLSGMWVQVDAPAGGLSGLEIVMTPPDESVGAIVQPVPLTEPGVGVVPAAKGIPFSVAGAWTVTLNAVTPNGVYNSPPQIFTIRNADGTTPTTDLVPPPVVTVTIPAATVPG